MSDPINDDTSSEDKDPPISLSSAFLAPLDSIFEAQIHAARSFLNFLLKMGFRHKYTEEDKEILKNEDPEKYNEVIDQEKQREADRLEIKQLFKKRADLLARNEPLSSEDIARLKELNARSGDLFQQSIDFIDNSGNEMMVNIPNLALLPIKPLSIQEAEFSYEFQVANTEKWTTKDSGQKKRPWFLIDEPRSIKGHFAPRKEQSSQSTIKINMKISNTEMPYGLEKLLIHLTNSMEVIDKQDN